jgi:hypothetical protein
MHELCSGKKVVLISATPLNNRPEDIANQIYLFQDKFNSTIPGIKNLKKFFDHIKDRFEEIKERQRQNSISQNEFENLSNEISKVIREKVLNHIMVRRTRKDILKYFKDDFEKKGSNSPKLMIRNPYFTSWMIILVHSLKKALNLLLQTTTEQGLNMLPICLFVI